MKRSYAGRKQRSLAATVALFTLAAVIAAVPARAVPAFKVLVFTKSASTPLRHASAPDAVAAIKALGAQNNFEVVDTEDPGVFTDTGLGPYQVIMFVHTQGDVLNDAQQAAMERFMRSGKGFAGVHSASDTEPTWAWYQALLGASFKDRPTGTLTATVKVADSVHRSTASLPRRWVRTDEWYNLKANPRGNVHVLATVDEKTYAGGSMGMDHPIAWCQGYQGARSWYTALGHSSSAWTSDAQFNNHILGGIKYAAEGDAKKECGATVNSNIDRITLDDRIDQPMSLEVAPDGRVFFIERTGNVKIFKPTGVSTGTTVTAGTISTSYEVDHGLQGIALDPAFATNGVLYLFYTAKAVGSAPERNTLSMFKINGDTLDISSEKLLLSFAVSAECCHQGGSLAFDSNGLLYLTTGDDSSADGSQGYAPVDETPGGTHNDAQRSSANSKDLRGKILRIKPNAATGTYTIPAGNLFTGSEGLPEIFVMGLRNPFRMTVDKATNEVYWGEVGPDAKLDDPARGPMGYEEFNRAKAAGNFGWPHCIADKKAYVEYNFATGQSGLPFNCDAPVNDSPRNTGARILPAVQSSLMHYSDIRSAQFPELGEGECRAAMAGPVYRYDAALASDRKFPAYYDGSLFVYDWCRGWIKEVKFDEQGEVLKINPFLPTQPFGNPIEMEQGPDGSLYVLDFGEQDGIGSYFSKANSGYLVRIDFALNGRTPVAKADKSAPLAGKAPLSVQFSSQGSYDPDPEDVVRYEWDFNSDGVIDSTEANPLHTYQKGDYTASLTVKDQGGKFSVTRLPISSGNMPATLKFNSPNDGSVHRFGEQVAYDLSVEDEEDGSTMDPLKKDGICSRVIVEASMIHGNHTHPLTQYQGCSGSVTTPDSSHAVDAQIYVVLTAKYTDLGVPGVAPYTKSLTHLLNPDRMQGEHAPGSYGTTIAPSGDTAGGYDAVTSIQHGDWISFKRVNLAGVAAINIRASSWYAGGRVEIRVGSSIGTMVGHADIPHTGDPRFYVDVVAPIASGAASGPADLYLVFQRQTGPAPTGFGEFDGAPGLFNINWIDFILAGKVPNLGTMRTLP